MLRMSNHNYLYCIVVQFKVQFIRNIANGYLGIHKNDN